MLISVPLKAPLADGSVDVTITVGVLNETGGGKETNVYHQVKFNVGPVNGIWRILHRTLTLRQYHRTVTN